MLKRFIPFWGVFNETQKQTIFTTLPPHDYVIKSAIIALFNFYRLKVPCSAFRFS